MSRVGFQKSVRMFHKFSEETTRRRGGNQAARDSIVHLAALDAVLKAERPFTPELLEPLAAFTNLLQSSQLPPEFGDYSFGDALLALEEAQAERRQNDPQVWEFEGEISDENAAVAATFATPPGARTPPDHDKNLRRFVLEAAQQVEPGSVLVVGALAEPALPLTELCSRFQRVTLNDVDLGRLEELVRRTVPDQQRERIKLERYDATGAAVPFASSVKQVMASAKNPAEAEEALVNLLQSYDVGAGSAGLSTAEEKPSLAISAMLLSRLGDGFAEHVQSAFSARDWQPGPALGAALSLFRCLLVQHHLHALLRRAKAAALVTAVSQVELIHTPNGQKSAVGEPQDLLHVERLVERLPQIAETKTEATWELSQELPGSAEKRSLLTLVEAVVV